LKIKGEGSEMPPMTPSDRGVGEYAVRIFRPQASGEPDAVKVARPVRRGDVGKVLA